MKDKIIPQDREHLIKLIKEEIRLNGNNCDLNHIDVSGIKNMEKLFFCSKFNGDISKWDVSRVENMHDMFCISKFNGDISNWNVSNVKNMFCMFSQSKFNNDISSWNVSNVTDMSYMFFGSEFQGDLTNWKPHNLIKTESMFEDSKAPIPYWANIGDSQKRRITIDNYHLGIELNDQLNSNNSSGKKPKI